MSKQIFYIFLTINLVLITSFLVGFSTNEKVKPEIGEAQTEQRYLLDLFGCDTTQLQWQECHEKGEFLQPSPDFFYWEDGSYCTTDYTVCGQIEVNDVFLTYINSK